MIVVRAKTSGNYHLGEPGKLSNEPHKTKCGQVVHPTAGNAFKPPAMVVKDMNELVSLTYEIFSLSGGVSSHLCWNCAWPGWPEPRITWFELIDAIEARQGETLGTQKLRASLIAYDSRDQQQPIVGI